MRNCPQRSLPKSKWVDVETRVAKKHRCCGCGVCAAMCPVECITISFNPNKEYRPFVVHNKCYNCGLCLQVCPDDSTLLGKIEQFFREHHQSLNKDELIGPFLNCYVGHVVNERERLASSSGGILTALLEELIELCEIDAVVLAGEADYRSSGKFFEAKIVTSVEEIKANRGSKYYPIEYSKVLKAIKTDIRRYAVVAIPCVANAIRKAQICDVNLQKNIRYILTPVCGHNVSGFYTEYILKSNNIDPSSVIKLNYRDKTGITSADDFNMAVEYIDKHGEKRIKRLGFKRSNVGETWYSWMFSMNKCLYCADFAGELSDASFADAWLEEYISDRRGTSLVIVRNVEIDHLLNRMVRAGKLKLHKVSRDTVVAAQRKRFYQKKELVRTRIRFHKMFNKNFPDYGIKLDNVDLWEGLLENLQLWLHVNLSKWLYRNGLLTKLGTCRFLKFVDGPIRWGVGIIVRVRRILKSK